MNRKKQGHSVPSRLSYANADPELAKDNPFNGKVQNLTPQFEQERCPLNARQLADVGTSEAQRRREAMAFKAKRRGQA